MHATSLRRFLLVVLVVSLLATSPASAQAVRSGGAVTVAEGEVHEGDLSAVGGAVIIDGRVNGDLESTAGSLLVTGTVTGDVEATAGSVTIRGVVEGDVEAGAGSVTVSDGARVGGSLEVGAGSLTVDGQVGGNVTAGVETLMVGETARIGGDLTYSAETVSIADGADVTGTTRRVDSLETDVGVTFPGADDGGLFPPGFFAVFGFLANLLLGVVLLLVAPRFGDRIAEVGTSEPVKAGAAGLATLVGVPVGLVVLAVTIVGVPLSIAGFVTYLLVLWVAFVYGAFVVGTWLLSLGEYTSRWGALVLGLALAAVASLLPLGGLVSLAYLLVGLGAFALVVLARRRGVGPTGVAEPSGETRPV